MSFPLFGKSIKPNTAKNSNVIIPLNSGDSLKIDSLMRIALGYYRNYQYTEAIMVFSSVLDLQPQNEKALYLRAGAYFKSEHWTKHLKMLLKLLL
jgi:cytochrome c-type biogenesis protein CcmH/NrfG